MSNILNNVQEFDGYTYQVSELIEASKGLEVIDIKVADIFLHYVAPNHKDTLVDFIVHYKRTRDANLKYPIILSPCNFILDGKHRICKALIEGKETIKAVRFTNMPDIGKPVSNEQ